MKYEVFLSAKAENSLSKIYGYIAENNPNAAARFVHALRKQCAALKAFPRGNPRAREDGMRGLEIRNTFYGSYRIIYAIADRR